MLLLVTFILFICCVHSDILTSEQVYINTTSYK